MDSAVGECSWTTTLRLMGCGPLPYIFAGEGVDSGDGVDGGEGGSWGGTNFCDSGGFRLSLY